GAVHINCPFAEPLYGNEEPAYDEWQQQLGDWWKSKTPWLSQPVAKVVAEVPDWDCWQQKKGVVLAGRMSAEEGVNVAKWAKALSWPLIGNALSQTGQPLPCADLWLDNPHVQEILAQAQLVVQFGSSLIGKCLLQWQAKCQP
ncbi:2-succinyl-5-enolpyruvyl-6-hydroxy-3-cyclohexene-1-carboxylate synthase, partial [Enterobacter hormaechei]|nr:2-succinyl-5-enolpyruvyl-6-hydroxy-3-cyclohexene-1-carboxylate synthase [Enterobacter hormaechei]